MYGLVAEKAKPGRFSTSKRGPRHQDHVKMNVYILGNAIAVQGRNDQKVANHARAKTYRKWDKLVIVVKQCPPFPKPALVKLTLEQLLQVLVLMPRVWETCLKMQHHGWKMMKIYKR
jgi:hypothetical protein